MSNLLLPSEIKKDIPGFEGIYYATTDGKIFSYKREYQFGYKYSSTNQLPEKELKKYPAGSGYLYVKLQVNKKSKNKSIHRLIAITFIPNPFNKPTVNHKDGNKLNNNYWNLEWATRKENSCHAVKN